MQLKQQGPLCDVMEPHGEKDEEGDHQTEEAHGLRQGKQKGIGGELLLARQYSQSSYQTLFQCKALTQSHQLRQHQHQ